MIDLVLNDLCGPTGKRFDADLKGCITCGDSIEEAIANAEDAKREWIIACLEDGIEILSKYA